MDVYVDDLLPHAPFRTMQLLGMWSSFSLPISARSRGKIYQKWEEEYWEKGTARA